MAKDKDNPEAPRLRKRAIRIGSLATLGRVASELARMYREARRGEISASDASKLASVLAVLRQCLEDLTSRSGWLSLRSCSGLARPITWSSFPARRLANGGCLRLLSMIFGIFPSEHKSTYQLTFLAERCWRPKLANGPYPGAIPRSWNVGARTPWESRPSKTKNRLLRKLAPYSPVKPQG